MDQIFELYDTDCHLSVMLPQNLPPVQQMEK